MAAYECLVGQSDPLDIVAWTRARVRDTSGNALLEDIPDGSYQLFCRGVGYEYSRWKPLGEFLIGNIGEDITSPITSVAFQQRYTVAAQNPPVMEITDVYWRVGQQWLVNQGDAALALYQPFLGLGRFTIDPAAISTRVIRETYLSELDEFGVGLWRTGRDGSGNHYVDVYPVPYSGGSPILLNYVAAHPRTASAGNDVFATVPDHHAQLVAKLLYASVLEDYAEKVSITTQAQAGIIRRQADPEFLYSLARKAREEVENALGAAVSIIDRS